MIVKRKLCSDLVLEQRDYGLISAFKNGLKKYKKFKADLKNIDNAIYENGRNAALTDEDLFYEGLKVNKNKKLGRNIAREAHKNNIRVFDNNGYLKAADNYTPDLSMNISTGIDQKMRKEAKKDLKRKDISRQTKKVAKTILNKKTKGIVNLGGNYYDRPDIMAHEVGHLLNEKNLKTKVIRKLHKFVNNNLINIEDRRINGKKPRLFENEWETANRGAQAILQPIEEKNAWKNGIKLLENNGASKEEIDQAKKIADLAVDNYKSKDKFELFRKIKENRKEK